MPWLGVLATLAWNYAIHQHRKKHCPDGCDHWYHRTICVVTRLVLPRWAIRPALGALGAFLDPHLRNGYPPRS